MLRGGMLTIVPPDESVTIGSLLHAVDVLLSLLQRNVHVSVYGLQFSCGQVSASKSHCSSRTPTFVDDSRIQLHRDLAPNNLAEETRWVSALALRCGSVFHRVYDWLPATDSTAQLNFGLRSCKYKS